MIYNFGVLDIKKKEDNEKYYTKWVNMIERCYSVKKREKYLTYSDVTVCKDWEYFSNFLAWCKEYENTYKVDCKDLALDKDLKGDKLYSPWTCCFLPKKVNTFLTVKRRNNTLKYIGVSFQKYTGKYKAEINDPFKGERLCLGYFDNPSDAAKTYTKAKLGIAKEIEDKGLIDYDPSLKGLVYLKIKKVLKDQL